MCHKKPRWIPASLLAGGKRPRPYLVGGTGCPPVCWGVSHSKVSLSDLVAVAAEDKKLGEVIVPPGKIGMATVSHTVVCAALIRAGIPVDSRFGGTVQIRNRQPLRFVDLIEYGGCSIDPAGVFIARSLSE